MVTELLKKYIWLVQTFIRAGERGLSLDEVCEKWEDRFDTGYSRRTFNNHREAVEEVFGIHIGCNRSTNRYFVEYSEDVSDEAAENAWLINTFTVNNMLSLGKERLSGRVSVEDIPSGHRHLTSIMEAMTENCEIVIGYRKYTSDQTSSYTIRPYAVKEFAKRWYIVGHCVERNGTRVYGLDRIMNMEITDRKFKMPKNFDVNELFATSFGIYIPEEKGRTIMFRTTRKEANFLRDLPIHPSQRELSIKEVRRHFPSVPPVTEDAYFEIFVCPNDALIMEFCKHGDRLEVLAPEPIRRSVASELLKAASQYEPYQTKP